MKPGTLYRSLEIHFTAEKTSDRRPSDGAVGPFIDSNEVPYLQMISVGPHTTSGWVKEGKKERTG